ncbi:hemerythrin domain-containing protein [Micromonospora sp. CPCC 206060]|uniref:hemerythrin domain-containing protein n=1 Tax=Micromonospora sp. CPCC 206060 TaxID=3122406 RepID=UPI002FF28A73
MSVPLPPLPPTDDSGYRPGGRSVVEIVSEEHRQLTGLCAELTDPGTDPQRRREVGEVFTAALSRHLSAEEQYLIPAARSALPAGDEVADGELATDDALLRGLAALSGTEVTDPAHAGLAGEIAELLGRHVRWVDDTVLPRLRRAARTEELIRLGNRLEIAEEAAPTRPHPDTPATPPWNRVVEPALGVVDKVRDAVTGRRTYPSDLDDPPRQ